MSLCSSPGSIFGPTPMFNISKFCIFYGAKYRLGPGPLICCQLTENPRKPEKMANIRVFGPKYGRHGSTCGSKLMKFWVKKI